MKKYNVNIAHFYHKNVIFLNFFFYNMCILVIR